jgi:hypothetical protein
MQAKMIMMCTVLMLLGACGGDPPEPAKDQESVFDPLVGTLDRAKGVQQTVDEQAAELKRQIEEAEGKAAN